MEKPITQMIQVDIGNKSYQALLSAEPASGFTVTVPELPGCIIYGEHIDHALTMTKEAIELCVETLKSEEHHAGSHNPIF